MITLPLLLQKFPTIVRENIGINAMNRMKGKERERWRRGKGERESGVHIEREGRGKEGGRKKRRRGGKKEKREKRKAEGEKRREERRAEGEEREEKQEREEKTGEDEDKHG